MAGAEGGDEVFDEEAVGAGVEGAVRQGGEVFRSAIDLEGDTLRAEGAFRALDDDPASFFRGDAVQLHPQEDAVVQPDPDFLQVVHVVVAVVDAAAVSTCFQFFLDHVFQRSPFRHVESRHPGFPVAVQLDGGIGAVQGAVQAANGGLGGSVVDIEFRQPAFR